MNSVLLQQDLIMEFKDEATEKSNLIVAVSVSVPSEA